MYITLQLRPDTRQRNSLPQNIPSYLCKGGQLGVNTSTGLACMGRGPGALLSPALDCLRADARVDTDLVAGAEREEAALLPLRSVRELAKAAKLATRDTLRVIHVFTPIYAVGCPLGQDLLPTLGEIATLNKEVNGEHFWMMNAPTIFANSRGCVFHRETRELIALSPLACPRRCAHAAPHAH